MHKYYRLGLAKSKTIESKLYYLIYLKRVVYVLAYVSRYSLR
jgi:hypothetical protein